MLMSYSSLSLGASLQGEGSNASLCHSFLEYKAAYSTLLPASLELSAQESSISLLTLC